jgi:TolA-binding protein
MTIYRFTAASGRIRWTIFMLGTVLMGMGCGSKSPEELFAAAESAAADSSSREQAVEDLDAFLDQYPRHESSARARKLLAVLAQQAGDARNAIEHYERLLLDYPRSEYGAEAQFMIAYIHEEYLKDLEGARSAYQRVIDNFPESDLAKSARYLLPNLGRDPEEWVKFGDDGEVEN